MYLCYLDESGTPQIPGTTSHYVLAGLAIPVWHWSDCDQEIREAKETYKLGGVEIHTGWLLRKYLEQSRIPDFEKMNYEERRTAAEKYRKSEIYRLQQARSPKLYKEVRKLYRKTEAYIHLTYDERVAFITEIAEMVSNWHFARLFAECIDKVHFDPNRASAEVDEQGFEQVVSRFEQYLSIIPKPEGQTKNFSLLIHDNNETAQYNLTQLMKRFHQKGTLWTRIENIIETPLFVDSELTSMVQIADLAAYALRRYLENGEETLFDLIFNRADRRKGVVVGVRHFTETTCNCKICQGHRK